MTDSITLKWGTLKGWELPNNQSALDAIKKYHDVGPVSWSVMAQKDTPEQKQALCDAIDALAGEIWNDWDGVTMAKDDAKKYVMEYRRG